MKNSEYLLAVTPITEILNKKPIQLTKKRVNQAGAIDTNIKNSISSFIDSEQKKEESREAISIDEFDNIKNYLESEDLSLEEKVKNIPDDELKTEIGLKINNFIASARELLPINRSETLFGSIDNPTSDFEKRKFMRQIRVLQNPDIVLDMLNSGTLSGIEIDAMAIFYPEYLGKLQEEVLNAIVEKQASKENVKFDRYKNRLLSTILQIPRISPETIILYQQNYLPKEEAQTSKFEMKPEANLTNIQRISAK